MKIIILILFIIVYMIWGTISVEDLIENWNKSSHITSSTKLFITFNLLVGILYLIIDISMRYIV